MPRRSHSEIEFEAQVPHLVEPAFDPPPRSPPAHLSEDMRDWWQQIGSTYVLESHHWKVLQTCCESWDLQGARQVLAEEGLTIETGTGSRKAHPCIAVERDARAQFLVALRQLDLDLEPPKTDKANWRPPPLRSNRTG